LKPWEELSFFDQKNHTENQEVKMRTSGGAGLIAMVGMLACAHAQQQMLPIQAQEFGSLLPFNAAMRSGSTLFLSGTMGSESQGTEIPRAMEDQVSNIFARFEGLLERADMRLEDVVSANVYLADARDYSEMNRSYRDFLGEDPPARATVETGLVRPEGLVEISLIAVHRTVERKVIRPSGWPRPSAPYSWGVLAGRTLYISGVVGTDPVRSEATPGDIKQQCDQAFKNVETIVRAAGLSLSDVVSMRVFLTDTRDFDEMNEAFRRFFPEDPPVRATVRARLANPRLRIEVQGVAYSGQKSFYRLPGSNAPFSHAIAAGDLIYVAGLVGRSESGFAPGDVAAQTNQTLDNIQRVLEEFACDLSRVADASVFLGDVRHYSAMNEVYRARVPTPFPARTTVGTELMSPEALVEIMMVAVTN
jgi:2-iminobutanoate/2-iminopropanoate deaminase